MSLLKKHVYCWSWNLLQVYRQPILLSVRKYFTGVIPIGLSMRKFPSNLKSFYVFFRIIFLVRSLEGHKQKLIFKYSVRNVEIIQDPDVSENKSSFLNMTL